MIYVTGDTHGDFRRFSTDIFPEQKEMTKEDFVIICGDFGGIWCQEDNRKAMKNENYWLDWLDQKPFTTLFVCGNHENFDPTVHISCRKPLRWKCTCDSPVHPSSDARGDLPH